MGRGRKPGGLGARVCQQEPGRGLAAGHEGAGKEAPTQTTQRRE